VNKVESAEGHAWWEGKSSAEEGNLKASADPCSMAHSRSFGEREQGRARGSKPIWRPGQYRGTSCWRLRWERVPGRRAGWLKMSAQVLYSLENYGENRRLRSKKTGTCAQVGRDQGHSGPPRKWSKTVGEGKKALIQLWADSLLRSCPYVMGGKRRDGRRKATKGEIHVTDVGKSAVCGG